MNKFLATCAAIAVTVFVMSPGAAGAAERDASGLRNSDQIEVSSVQRYRRYGTTRRYYGRSYARPYYRNSYYASPGYGYGYSRGPGWGPAPFPFVMGLPY